MIENVFILFSTNFCLHANQVQNYFCYIIQVWDENTENAVVNVIGDERTLIGLFWWQIDYLSGQTPLDLFTFQNNLILHICFESTI